MSEAGTGGGEQGVGRIVASVRRSERLRLGVIGGVSLLFFLFGELTANLGVIPLGLAVVLFVFLYTRPSAEATVTASTIGPGLLFFVLYLYDVFRPFEGPIGGYDPFTSLLLRKAHWLVLGIPLLVLGAWLRRRMS